MATPNFAAIARQTISRVLLGHGVEELEIVTRADTHIDDAQGYLATQYATRLAERRVSRVIVEGDDGGDVFLSRSMPPLDIRERLALVQAVHDLEVYVTAQGW
jgi:hypothetical protein